MSARKRKPKHRAEAAVEAGTTLAAVREERIEDMRAKLEQQRTQARDFVAQWRAALLQISLLLTGVSAFKAFAIVGEKDSAVYAVPDACAVGTGLCALLLVNVRGSFYFPALAASIMLNAVYLLAWFLALDPLEKGTPLAGTSWPTAPTYLAVVLSAELFMLSLLNTANKNCDQARKLAEEAIKS
jgi:hypothetical protein